MSGAFGLSALPPSVARALASVYGHHRTPWFEGILKDLSDRLRSALGERYTPLFLTCTGLGAREAVVANLIRPTDSVLATPGDFTILARAWGADVTACATPLSAVDVAPDAVFIEHVLASGDLVDVGALVGAVRRAAPSAPIVLDASISFGVDASELQTSGVDAVILVPERGLMSVPGVAIVAVTQSFIETLVRIRPTLVEQPFLFDLLKYHRASSKHTTPFSPNISACIALQAALAHIDAKGGLAGLHQDHQVRAAAIRECLTSHGMEPIVFGTSSTNAWTSFDLPSRFESADALGTLRAAGIDARQSGTDPSRIDIAHAGYMPGPALDNVRATIARLFAPVDASVIDDRPRTADDVPPIEAPFTIAADELIEQAARLAARSSSDEGVREKVALSARRVFRDEHTVHADAIRHRTVGFVGAGRIVKCAIDLCRQRGIQNVIAYSPSLAAAKANAQDAGERSELLAEWNDRGVAIASTLEELFEACHAVVLLPVLYDEAALGLFRKPRRYRNVGLVSAQLLERAERAGRLDLIINAAARGALVDRPALVRAVEGGWLRYFSDEMPSADDPLLGFDHVRFTGHVGGSCRAPQAAVARNTHTILRRVLGAMLETHVDDADPGYQLSVVNGHLLTDALQGRQEAAARDMRACGRARILLTDPFDIESLAFDRLEDLGIDFDVHDLSGTRPSTESLTQALTDLRPHVVMLRSRTRVDPGVARTMAAIQELACVIRPGVGVDNLFGGLEHLSAAGVQIINEPYGNSRAVAEMALHFILSGTETTLLAPGPTNVHPDVFDVAQAYDVVKLADPFRPAATVDGTLGPWLGARSASVTISGPGTALMEASIANLTSPGDRGLVISHGKFGERFVEIARARGRGCDVLGVDEERWGAAVTPHDVDRFLQQDEERRAGGDEPPVAFLCFQQNETSSGVTYHQPAIRALVRVARAYNPRMMIIADAISGALAHRLEFDALDLDMLFLGSQKALGVSSGLAFAVLGERAVESMLGRAGYDGGFAAFCEDPHASRFLGAFDRQQRVHSTSLLRAVLAGRRRQYVDTPSLFHLLSTERALDLFGKEGGPEALARRHAELAQLVREGLRELGLELMPSPPFESDSVTVALLPPGIEASAIRKAVARHSAIAIAGAQGDFWKPRMLRVGTLGFVSRGDVTRCLRALRVALGEAGFAPALERATLSHTSPFQ